MQRMIFFILIIFLFISLTSATDSSQQISNTVLIRSQDLGTEKRVINGRTVILKVNKIEHDKDHYSSTGEEVTRFFKDCEDVSVDSVVYADGSSFVDEFDFLNDIHKQTNRVGVVHYIFWQNYQIIKEYIIGEKKETLYKPDGNLKPEYQEVRGDTAFVKAPVYSNIQTYDTDSGYTIMRVLH